MMRNKGTENAALPVITTRTFTVFEVMETFVVSHDQLPTNDLGHDLDEVVTVPTHTEILDDCERLPRWGAYDTISNR